MNGRSHYLNGLYDSCMPEMKLSPNVYMKSIAEQLYILWGMMIFSIIVEVSLLGHCHSTVHSGLQL